MIRAHCPSIFGDRVIAGVSDATDGNMKLIGDSSSNEAGNDATRQNIANFIHQVGIGPDRVTYQSVDYDTPDFCRYVTVGRTPAAFTKVMGDALITTDPATALFLPLADCTGAILYDPEHDVLAVAHLGRHSTEQRGAQAIVTHMAREFQTDPTRLLVWLGPSPNGGIYPLWQRDNMSLHEANLSDLHAAGVPTANIEVSPVDTATDTDYFSHSEFLKGRRDKDGRYAIIAVLAPRG